jgi:hypothetical protein
MSVRDKTLPTLNHSGGAGRPTKKSKKLIAALLEAIEAGAPYKIACASVGLSVDAFLNWRREDPKFAAKVEETAAKGTISRLKRIDKHGDETFAALAWLLERQHPSEFSRLEVQLGVAIQNNMSGANGKNFEIVVVEDLEFMGLRQRSEYTHNPDPDPPVREVETSVVRSQVAPELSGHLSREGAPTGIVISRSEHEENERRSARIEAEVDKLLELPSKTEDTVESGEKE